MITINDLTDRATITIPECAELLQIGRNSCYQAAARGEIPTLRLGHQIRVPVKRLLVELLGYAPTDSDAAPSTDAATASTSNPAPGALDASQSSAPRPAGPASDVVRPLRPVPRRP